MYTYIYIYVSISWYCVCKCKVLWTSPWSSRWLTAIPLVWRLNCPLLKLQKCHSRHHWRMTLGRMSARSLDLYQCVFMLSSGTEVESDESDSSPRSFCKPRGLKIGQFSARFSWKTDNNIYRPFSYLFQWQPSNLNFLNDLFVPKFLWWIWRWTYPPSSSGVGGGSLIC